MKTRSSIASVERLRELARDQASLAKSCTHDKYKLGLVEGMRIAYYDAASRLEWQIEQDKREVSCGNH